MTVVLLDADLAAGVSAAFGSGQQIWITTIEGDRHPEWKVVTREWWKPPERFRVLDKPCGHCEATGKLWYNHGPLPATSYNADCFHCAGGGREVVEFHTTCQHANATKPHYGGGNYGDYGTQTCKDCGARRDDWSPWSGGSGSVLVFKGTCRVVPVVDTVADLCDAVVAKQQCIRVFKEALPNRAFLVTPGNDLIMSEFACDPLPVPGRDFGLVFEAVS